MTNSVCLLYVFRTLNFVCTTSDLLQISKPVGEALSIDVETVDSSPITSPSGSYCSPHTTYVVQTSPRPVLPPKALTDAGYEVNRNAISRKYAKYFFADNQVLSYYIFTGVIICSNKVVVSISNTVFFLLIFLGRKLLAPRKFPPPPKLALWVHQHYLLFFFLGDQCWRYITSKAFDNWTERISCAVHSRKLQGCQGTWQQWKSSQKVDQSDLRVALGKLQRVSWALRWAIIDFHIIFSGWTTRRSLRKP